MNVEELVREMEQIEGGCDGPIRRSTTPIAVGSGAGREGLTPASWSITGSVCSRGDGDR